MFWIFFLCTGTVFNPASSATRPSDSTVSEDAGIEHMTVATSTLASRRFDRFFLTLFLFQSAFTGLKMKVEKHMRAVNSLPAELAPIDFAAYK